MLINLNNIHNLQINFNLLIQNYKYYILKYSKLDEYLSKIQNLNHDDKNIITSSPNILPFTLFDFKQGKRLVIFALDIKAMHPSLKHKFLIRMVDFYWEKYKHNLPHIRQRCIKSVTLLT